MPSDLQELRHDRVGGTAEPVRPRPAGRRHPAFARRRGVGPFATAAERAVGGVQGPEAQEQKIAGPGAAGEDVQGERVLDPDAAAGVRPRGHVLQVPAAPQIHAVLVPQLETPFARRRRPRHRRRRRRRRQRSNHLTDGRDNTGAELVAPAFGETEFENDEKIHVPKPNKLRRPSGR